MVEDILAMEMKKICVLLGILVLLVGCGSNPSAASADTPSAATAAPTPSPTTHMVTEAELARAKDRGNRWLKSWGIYDRLEALRKEFLAHNNMQTFGPHPLKDIVDKRKAIENEINERLREAHFTGAQISVLEWRGYSGHRVETRGPILYVFDEKEPPK